MQIFHSVVTGTITLVLTFAGCATSSAQTNTDGFTPAAIMPGSPAGSYTLGGFDTVNFANGYVNFRFPLVTIGGRGKASTVLMPNFTIIWKVTPNVSSTNCGQGQTGCSFTYNYTIAPDPGGWAPVLPQWGGGAMAVRSSGQLCNAAVPGNPSYPMWWTTGLTRLTYIAPDQTEMELVDKPTGGTPQPESPNSTYNRSTVFVSHDGSSAVFTATQDVLDASSCGTYSGGIAGTLVTKDGVKHTFDGGGHETQIEDPNGNVITLGGSTIVDAIGRQYQIGQGGACTLLTYPGFNGNSRTIKVCHDTLHNVLRADQSLQPVQSLWNVIANSELANYNQVFDISNLISEIDLPDGSAYKFKYDSYGSVARVELPTGGAVEYDYTQVTGYATDPSSVQIVNLSRALVERREYLNVSDSTPSRVSKYNGQTVMDYDGQGNLLAKTVHNVVPASIAPVTNPTLYEYGLIGKEMETKYYAGDGQTILRDVVNQWQLRSCGYQSTCGNPAGAPFDPMLTSVTTTQNGVTKQTTFGYDAYNNVNDQKDFDWRPGTPGPLLRHIVTSYEPGAYDNLPVYQPGLPSQVNTYDGGGNLVALTYIHHDQFGLADAPGIIDHDGAYDLNNTVRGNITQKSSWINTSGSYETESFSYDIAGNLVSSTDGKGNATQFGYNDDPNNLNTYARVTSVTSAAGQKTLNYYDIGTGKLRFSTDPNGATTAYEYNDPLDRLTKVAKWNSYINYVYNGTTSVVSYEKQADNWDAPTETDYDGMGRAIASKTYEDPSHAITTTTSYDALGRVHTVSNPMRAGDPFNVTTYNYDALGRTTSIVAPDNAASVYSYSGWTTTVTDAANKIKQYGTDALGRLGWVIEDPAGLPNSNPQPLNFLTNYSYDALGNLTGVTQGSQTRSFVYDSLSRLKSATNPESGTISYDYDSGNNLLHKTDGRGVVTTYGYDVLNRVSAISYSDGTPGVSFAYDTVSAYGKGRLASVCTGSYQCESMVSYDPLGRVTASRQNLMGNVYSFSYGYNYRGALTSETYPSGRVVTTVYDSVDRPYTVSGVLGGETTNYMTGAAYAAQGGPAQISLGNSVSEHFEYNSRLQMNNWWAQKGTDQAHSLLWQTLNYGTPAANNGNLQGMDEYVGGPGYPSYTHFGQSFTYDGVNRLTSASEPGGWSRSFGYDSYGNRWVSGASGVPLSGLTPTSNSFTSANQIYGQSYDLAGNQTSYSTYTVAYDAENRIRSVVNAPAAGGGWVNYSYDANGKRVIKQYSDGGTVFYVYDAFGQLAAEYSSAAKTTNPACGTCYLTTDHLGSTRLITDEGANVIARHDFLPFGEEIPAGTAGRDGTFGLNASVNQKFTGQERDVETGLDYFFARYLSAQQGRFLSVDPENMGADPTDPQSWNGYSYVRNSPLNATDPTGMFLSALPPNNGDDGSYDGNSIWDPCLFCFFYNPGPSGGSGQQQPPPPPPPQKPIVVGSTQSGTCPVPPAGPIDYSAVANANSKLNILSLIPQFLNGGKQDYKGRSEFGNLQNREAVGNFAFGATGAARGWTYSQTMMYAGVGAVISNTSTQFRGMLAQSANMQGQYGGSTNAVPHVMPASSLGPGFPGFPVIAPNGIPTQGDQVGWNENAAVANGFVWQSNGCHR